MLRSYQHCCFQLRITILKKMTVTVNESILHEYQQYNIVKTLKIYIQYIYKFII